MGRVEPVPTETKIMERLKRQCENDIKTILASKPKPIIIYSAPPELGAKDEVMVSVIYENKRRHFWALTLDRARTLANDYLISQGWTGEL